MNKYTYIPSFDLCEGMKTIEVTEVTTKSSPVWSGLVTFISIGQGQLHMARIGDEGGRGGGGQTLRRRVVLAWHRQRNTKTSDENGTRKPKT